MKSGARALLLAPRLPGTGFTGDRVRTGFLLAGLSRAGFETTLVGGVTGAPGPAPAQPDAVRVRRTAESFAGSLLESASGGGPFQSALASGDWAGALSTHSSREGRPDLVVVVMARLWPLVSRSLPDAPVVVDFVDALSEAARQAARQDPSPLRRLYWRLEAPRLRRAEEEAAARAALLLATTPADAAALPPGTVAIAHGVAIGPALDDAPRPPVVAFTGRLGYRPNEVAALRLVRSVWPRVRRAVPGARLVLAGADAPASIRRLSGSDGILVESPAADLAALLRGTRAVALPLAMGTGTPNKLFEALEAGAAVVSLPETARRAAPPGGAPPPVREARDDAEMAEALVALLRDEPTARAEGAAGRAWVERNADRRSAEGELALLLARAAGGGARP